MFPLEIWRVIWDKVDDPVALTRLRGVCKTWYHGIDETLSTHQGWQRLSQDLVPEFWRHDMLRMVNRLNNWNLPNEWRKVYSTYKVFQRNIEYPRPVAEGKINDLLKFSDSERITSMDVVWEDVVVFSTTEGLLYFCHFRDLKNPFFIADHGQCVTEVKLWTRWDGNNDNRLQHIGVSIGVNEQVKYWDVEKRKEIVSDGHSGDLIEPSSKECFVIGNGAISQCEARADSISRVWELHLFPSGTSEKIFLFSSDYEIALSVDEESCTTKLYSVPNLTARRIPSAELLQVQYFPADCASSSLKKFYMFSNTDIACITDNLMAFSFSNGNWVTYDMHNCLGGNVRSIYSPMDGCHLVMGLDTGDVYIFNVEHISDWSAFTFSRLNGTRITLDSGPINFLDTWWNDYIIAATERSIHVHELRIDIHSRHGIYFGNDGHQYHIVAGDDVIHDDADANIFDFNDGDDLSDDDDVSDINDLDNIIHDSDDFDDIESDDDSDEFLE